jgi:hypothetical protein
MECGAEEVRLVLADEAQKVERDRLTVSAWGEGLTLDGYLRREQSLRAIAVPRLGMRTWLLVDARQRVLSSCETFAIPSVFRPDEGEEWGWSSGVASVFSEEPLRRQGHATRMLDLLCATLAAEDAAHAVVLFSDVGEAQYARSGFHARLAYDWTWPPAGAAVTSQAALFGEEALGWRWGGHPVPAGRLVLHPSSDVLEWFREREHIYCSELGRPRPAACGAALGDSLALFYAQPKDNRLWIHWLSADSARTARALVTAARTVARDAGLSEVRFWEDTDGFPHPDGLEGGVRGPRQGGLPMIRPLDTRIRPADWRCIPRALWV